MKYKVIHSIKSKSFEDKLNDFTKDKRIINIQFSTSNCAAKGTLNNTIINLYAALIEYEDLDEVGE